MINRAIAERAARDQHLAVLAELVADYERTHGELTDGELAAQAQADRDAAAAARASAHVSG